MYKTIKKNRIRGRKSVPGTVMAAFLCAACLLGGCTRREQLVLETGDGAGSGMQAGETAAGSLPPEQPAALAEDPLQAGQPAASSDPTQTEGTGEAAPGAAWSADAGYGVPEAQSGGLSGSEAVICVHVCGAVKKAGVYELPAGSRVFEAVAEAGGFTEEADESYLNQAQQLSDGAKLVVPTTEQTRRQKEAAAGGPEQIGIVEQDAVKHPEGYGISAGSGNAAGGPEAVSDGKININTASEAQLCEIPGIGATRAAAIVAYRQEAGGFGSIEEIMNVSGIKEGTYAKIRDKIRVE